MPKIRIAIVDDSLYFRTFLSQKLVADHSIEIVGSFADPADALKQIPLIRPDVITVNTELPSMSGNDFINGVIKAYPNAKCVIISSLSNKVFDAMQAGAIDFVDKPGARTDYNDEQFVGEILNKIKTASAAHRTAADSSLQARTASPVHATSNDGRLNSIVSSPYLPSVMSNNIIAIGASTGGTEAILDVIKRFPVNTPGVVIVQHMPQHFTKMYAERADSVCAINVKEAQNGDRVEPGTALIAPGGGQQMQLRRDSNGYYVYLSNGEKVSGHCPSVDVLFNSVARVAAKDAVGVLLTGMGADGAKGLTAMRKAGAHTIGQDEASCVVYGMPMVAFKMGGVSEQLPLRSIGDAVLRRFR